MNYRKTIGSQTFKLLFSRPNLLPSLKTIFLSLLLFGCILSSHTIFAQEMGVYFAVNPVDDGIWEWGEQPAYAGQELKLTIRDSSGILYEDFTQIDSDGRFRFIFSGQFDIIPGQVITLTTESGSTNSHQVTWLQLSEVDPVAETISGVADIGEVGVDVYIDNQYAYQDVQTDASCNWVANFSGELNIELGAWGHVIQRGVNGNVTHLDWPRVAIAANPDTDSVWESGKTWSVGLNLSLTVDVDTDPNNGLLCGPFFTAVGENQDFRFNVGDQCDIQRGNYVRVSGGTFLYTRLLQVANLRLTGFDLSADLVMGTADPGTEVSISAYSDQTHAERRVYTDEFGNWLADFSIPGDQEPFNTTLDIQVGTYGNVYQSGDGGDRTNLYWVVEIIDADQDGIPDSDDVCAMTAEGDAVNEEGCSIAQICPCAQLGNGNIWENHGAYVSCVAHTSEEFVNNEWITEAEKDAIVSAAAQSSCGK